MQFTHLDGAVMKLLREDIDTVLLEVAARRGITLKLGKGRFSNDNATFNLDVATISKDGLAKTKEASNFKLLCFHYDLTPEDLGAKFLSNGRHFTLTGLNPMRPKFPFVAICTDDNKTYKLTQASVLAGIKR
jgi:hypothetical protein